MGKDGDERNAAKQAVKDSQPPASGTAPRGIDTAPTPADLSEDAANDATSLANDVREEFVGKDRLRARQTGSEELDDPMNPAAPTTTRVATRPPPPPPHVAMVLSEPIQKLIAKRLVRMGVREADREDFQQDVTIALITMDNPPTDVEGCSKAAHDIVGKKVTGAYRKAIRRGRHNVGPTDLADEHASDQAREKTSGEYVQRQATVEEALADGTLSDRDARILALKHEGKTDAEIASELGLSQQTVSNIASRARSKMRVKWSKRMAAVAALALAVIVILFAIKKRNDEAHNRVLPTPAPSVPHLEPEIPVTLNGPIELRQSAKKACDDQAWDLCAAQLDQAAKLDPGGDLDPAVRDLRHALEDRPSARGTVGAKPGLHR